MPTPDRQEPIYRNYPEWLDQSQLETVMESEAYLLAEANHAQNPDRGLRSETLYIHSESEQPEVILLGETTMPAKKLRPFTDIPLQPKHPERVLNPVGVRRRWAVIYSEGGGPNGSVTLTDMHSIPARHQTSWHRSISMQTIAANAAELDESMPSVHEFSKPVRPGRYINSDKDKLKRNGHPNRHSHMKNYGNNLGAKPAVIERRKQKVIAEEKRKTIPWPAQRLFTNPARIR